jgi:hypothetical protein
MTALIVATFVAMYAVGVYGWATVAIAYGAFWLLLIGLFLSVRALAIRKARKLGVDYDVLRRTGRLVRIFDPTKFRHSDSETRH